MVTSLIVGKLSRNQAKQPVVGVADGDDLRPDVHFRQVAPSRDGAAELAAHQPQTDNAEPDRSHPVIPLRSQIASIIASMASTIIAPASGANTAPLAS